MAKRPSSRSSRWCCRARSSANWCIELIRRAIDALEPAPGVARASETEIENAVQAAVETVAAAWPLERAVPPPLLWRHTLEEAARLTVRGLTVDDSVMADTRSWTELAFGEEGAAAAAGFPGPPDRAVTLPGTAIRLRGRIDRVDLRGDNSAIRITDYKSGKAPKNAGGIVLAGGGELQRVLYAMAARVLLPEVRMIVSRLVVSRRGQCADAAAGRAARCGDERRRRSSSPSPQASCGPARRCRDPMPASAIMICASPFRPTATPISGASIGPSSTRSMRSRRYGDAHDARRYRAAQAGADGPRHDAPRRGGGGNGKDVADGGPRRHAARQRAPIPSMWRRSPSPSPRRRSWRCGYAARSTRCWRRNVPEGAEAGASGRIVGRRSARH